MSVKQIEKRIEAVETELGELKTMKASYTKLFTTTNGNEPAPEPTTGWKGSTRRKNNFYHKPVGDYEGLTIADATFQCLTKARKSLHAREVAEIVFDTPEAGTKKFRRLYYAAWNAMYRQTARIEKMGDGMWKAA